MSARYLGMPVGFAGLALVLLGLPSHADEHLGLTIETISRTFATGTSDGHRSADRSPDRDTQSLRTEAVEFVGPDNSHASRLRPIMNSSLIMADRTTRLKILIVSLLASILLL